MKSLAGADPLKLEAPEALHAFGSNEAMAREDLRAVALGAQEIGDDETRIIAAAIGISEGVAEARLQGERLPGGDADRSPAIPREHGAAPDDRRKRARA